MSDYKDSAILYPVERCYRGKVDLDGVVWYITVVGTGISAPAPSHQLLMANANRVDFTGTALFRNEPGGKSLIGGKIEMFKSYYVDIYHNESKTGGDPFLTIRFKEKTSKPEQKQQEFSTEIKDDQGHNTGVQAFI